MEPPCLVLCDLLPDGSGESVITACLTYPALAATKVVLATASVAPWADGVEVLEKPFRAADLRAVVERCCGARPASR